MKINGAALSRSKEHIASFYAANPSGIEQFNRLEGKMQAQTCVIGGGLAGLTCALELARTGNDVVLLEANRVGWGASGRNGGFVGAGFARSNASIISAAGLEDARELYKLSGDGRDYVAKQIEVAARPEVILGRGWLNVQRRPNLVDLQQNFDFLRDKFGANCELLNGLELEKYVKSSNYYGGILDKDAIHIEPLQYSNLLAARAQKNGARIFEQSRCLSLSKCSQSGEARWLVKTESGAIKAHNIILATSAYGGPYARLNRALVPVATYVVASEPVQDLLDYFIPFKGCIADTRRAGDYYRTVGAGNNRRLVWGGRITTRKSQPVKLAQMLKADIIDVYPELSDIKLKYSWSGLMGYAPSQMPIIGRLDEGLWAATAFGGHGLNTTAMAGQLIAGAIAHGDDRYRLFEKFGPAWAGGIIGQWATQFAYWKLQAQDWWDEKGAG